MGRVNSDTLKKNQLILFLVFLIFIAGIRLSSNCDYFVVVFVGIKKIELSTNWCWLLWLTQCRIYCLFILFIYILLDKHAPFKKQSAQLKTWFSPEIKKTNQTTSTCFFSTQQIIWILLFQMFNLMIKLFISLMNFVERWPSYGVQYNAIYKVKSNAPRFRSYITVICKDVVSCLIANHSTYIQLYFDNIAISCNLEINSYNICS